MRHHLCSQASATAAQILREYEPGVTLRLGRQMPHAKGPGLILVFAPVDRMVRMSLRQEALEVPPQDITCRSANLLRKHSVLSGPSRESLGDVHWVTENCLPSRLKKN